MVSCGKLLLDLVFGICSFCQHHWHSCASSVTYVNRPLNHQPSPNPLNDTLQESNKFHFVVCSLVCLKCCMLHCVICNTNAFVVCEIKITYLLAFLTMQCTYVLCICCFCRDRPKRWQYVPDTRVVIFIVRAACGDGRVGVECALFVAIILPLEWQDAIVVPDHDLQQLVAHTCYHRRLYRVFAVVAYYRVIRLRKYKTERNAI